MRVCDSNGDLGLWTAKSNNFIIESKWMLVPSVKESLQGIAKILLSQEWGSRTDPKNIMAVASVKARR